MSALPAGAIELGAARAEADPEARESARPRKPSFVRFVDDAGRDRLCDEAWRARALIARPGPTLPGKLGRALDAAVESALARRGAMPPVSEIEADPSWIVSDQLFRAAALPARELVLCVPPLRALADRGRLRDDDAAALMAWIDAARTDTRIVIGVLLEEADRDIELRVPRPLDEVVWDAGAGSLVSMVPRVEERRTDLSPPPVAPTLRPSSDEVEAAAADDEGDDGDDGQDLAEVLTSAEETKLPDLVLEEKREEDERRETERLLAERLEAERLLAERLEAERMETERLLVERALAAKLEAERLEAERLETERVERMLQLQHWRELAIELDAARGPRPAAQVERLFVEKYVPLLGAVQRGEVDIAVRDIVRGWRDGFAESYEAAYATIRVTGKRPTMVMDAPEVAHRVARLSSARSVKLVLVDAMSFDLSERVAQRLKNKLEKRAVLAERTLLWSALPASTPTQMHLLARGTQGFADLPPTPSEPDISRGRNVAAFRRERLGAREVLKLDLVEARLRGPGPAYDERLDAIADELSQGLLKLFESMPPRTLVYVFGDHGFVLGSSQNGQTTVGATQGGASPEEVLVAGQGWLVDAVQ